MNSFRLFFAVLAVLLAQPAISDELRPGYLEMRQTSPGAYNLLFKIPARGEDLRLAIYVKLPEGTQDVAPPRASFSDGAYVERRTIRRDGGLVGQPVSIEGLSATSTDVLVRIESLGGAVQTERLSPTKTSFIIQAVPGAGEVAATYLRLGVEHILFGFDHLLFVLALVILVRDWRRVAVTVTAFTIAHSITLAAATLGFVNVPGPPVGGNDSAQHHAGCGRDFECPPREAQFDRALPWLVAFCFGLLHGFGFAGALAEVGLPQHAIPVALLFFNVGVEIGQLIFVAAVLSLISLLRYVASKLLEPARIQPSLDRLDVTVAYAIGVMAAYWLIERTTAFFAAHFPEVRFEPGGLLEDHDQFCLAGRRGVEIGETIQVRPRLRRDLLVWCTGILGDPNAIWIRRSERVGSRGEPRGDLCVADHAGGKRHLECQQITAHSGVEHVASISQCLDRRRGPLEIADDRPQPAQSFT